jgi:pimeloyl-ACP methyl ester carboxylesterase
MAFALAGLTACAPSEPLFEAGECPANIKGENVVCGVVRVPENYDVPGGRQIALNVVVLRATGTPQTKVAEFDLDGGPGYDVTFSAGFYLGEGKAFRRGRDVVLADQRGTGGSGALRCPAMDVYDRQRPILPMYSPELVKECATALSATADLTQYTTAASARDIDAIRRALGYRQFSLVALSYGTTLALRYISDFATDVHSAVLIGTVPADRTPPRHHATVAERALRLVLADCASDPACAEAFPGIEADLSAALARLDAQGGFARSVFMEGLRTRMYSPEGMRDVPLFVHAAARGEFAAFDAAVKPSGAGRQFAEGLYLSITCNETMARIHVDEAIAVSAKTPFGAYRLERQKAACGFWPRGPLDPDLFGKARSDVPVLFLSGAFDPVTPPQWAAEAAARFSNSRHIVVPRGSHVFDGLSGLDTCFDKQVLAFIDEAAPQKVDATCFGEMRGAPYRTK